MQNGPSQLTYAAPSIRVYQLLEQSAFIGAGVLAGTEEAKVSAVRGAALAALGQLLDGAGGGALLPEAEQQLVHQRLTAMAASERNAALAAQVSTCMRLRCCC